MAAAAKNPEPGVVSALLEAGADIQGKNDAGWTALIAAAQYGSAKKGASSVRREGDLGNDEANSAKDDK